MHFRLIFRKSLRFDVRFGEEKEKRNEIKISNIFNI